MPPIHSYVGQKAARPSTCAKTPKICHNTYRDTVENGSTLGKFGIHDPQLDAKALLPTHTFSPCWNLRKSPKRPALPGAVISGRCRSLAPTLSPALFSHPLSAASCLGCASGLCRPARACFFLFCLSSARSSFRLRGWGWLSLIQVRRCPGFVHNWVTRLQQGLSRASVVSFSYLDP